MHDRHVVQLAHAIEDLKDQRLHEGFALRAWRRHLRAAAPREEIPFARELHDDVSGLSIAENTQQRASVVVLVRGAREEGSAANADPRLLFLAGVLPVELLRLLAYPRIRDLLDCNLVACECVDHEHHLAVVADSVLDLADKLETRRLPSLHVADVECCLERLQACACRRDLMHAAHLDCRLRCHLEKVTVFRPLTRGARSARSLPGPRGATHRRAAVAASLVRR
mmetsp:Transcript_31517/g.104463  ORF Transcript_31517/g.104463 Transcript_31517/m.104463 type:complete len:225 (-) Transcript_31517:101-775(-)